MAKWKTKNEYDNVMKLYNSGTRVCDIVTITGLKRSCINNWVRGLSKVHKDDYIGLNRLNGHIIEYSPINNINDFYSKISLLTSIQNKEELNACYSYLFGLYLGDGLCRQVNRSHVLTYSLDCKYMDLIEFTKNNIQQLFGKTPSLCDKRNYVFASNSFDVKITSKVIRPFFPQGEEHGVKHLRKIEMENWQKEILNPLECLRGLIYSDGTFINANSYKTFRYEFSNCSSDIIEIFKLCCDKLNLRYNCHQKKTMHGMATVPKYAISIAYQDDVRWLMKRIGTKKIINHKLNIKNSDGYYDSDLEFSKLVYDNLPDKMKLEWECCRCKKECFSNDSDTYYLNDNLWKSINGGKKTGMICLECLTNILKTQIKIEDLKDDNVNKFLNPSLINFYK